MLVKDNDFEAKRRKIFQALYKMKRELQAKQKGDVDASGASLGSAATIDKELEAENAVRYHGEENFFNSVYHNHTILKLSRQRDSKLPNAKSTEPRGRRDSFSGTSVLPKNPALNLYTS